MALELGGSARGRGICSALLVWRRVVVGRTRYRNRRIVRWDVLSSLDSLFCALIADDRVDEEADKGETVTLSAVSDQFSTIANE